MLSSQGARQSHCVSRRRRVSEGSVFVIRLFVIQLEEICYPAAF